MLFGSPLTRPVHEPAWHRPQGNIDFRVTQVFGCTGVPQEPRLGACDHFHRAIDLGNGRRGDDVVAAAAGKVRFSDRLNIGGRAILIDHGDGWWSEYAHLRDFVATAGIRVEKGQLIAHVGRSGAVAAHLHFGVKRKVRIGPAAGPGSAASQYYNEDNDRDHWQNPWLQLEQNVRIHPRVDVADIRIRTEPKLGPAFIFAATTAGGTIRRASDGADLGPTVTWRDWGGRQRGEAFTLPDGQQGDTWDRIELGGAFRFIATPLAVLSAS